MHANRRTSEPRVKKIAAHATDALGIDRQERWRGEGRQGNPRRNIIAAVLLRVEIRCTQASEAIRKETHPNHVRSEKFTMPRALSMQFIAHEGLLAWYAVERRFSWSCFPEETRRIIHENWSRKTVTAASIEKHRVTWRWNNFYRSIDRSYTWTCPVLSYQSYRKYNNDVALCAFSYIYNSKQKLINIFITTQYYTWLSVIYI